MQCHTFNNESVSFHTLIMFYKSLRDPIVAFLAEEDGTAAVEYAVTAALIVGVIVGSVTFLSAQTMQTLDDSSDAISGAWGN